MEVSLPEVLDLTRVVFLRLGTWYPCGVASNLGHQEESHNPFSDLSPCCETNRFVTV